MAIIANGTGFVCFIVRFCDRKCLKQLRALLLRTFIMFECKSKRLYRVNFFHSVLILENDKFLKLLLQCSYAAFPAMCPFVSIYCPCPHLLVEQLFRLLDFDLGVVYHGFCELDDFLYAGHARVLNQSSLASGYFLGIVDRSISAVEYGLEQLGFVLEFSKFLLVALYKVSCTDMNIITPLLEYIDLL